VIGGVEFADFASHAKISEFTDTHFVNQDILQLDVSVDITHCVMEVLKTPYDLPEHHAYVVVREGRVAITLENVKHRASGAELSDEVIGVGSVVGFEKGENVFVVK